MNKQLALLASVVVVAVIAFLGWWMHDRPRHPHHDKAKVSNSEAAAIDQTDTSVSMIAMLNAPDAATPCETAYAAIEAESAAAKLHGGKSMFTWVAGKPAFVAQCQTLPVEAQQCMMPRYRRDHADACLQHRPPADVLKKLYAGAPIVEPTYER
jgi:hypothetical protein